MSGQQMGRTLVVVFRHNQGFLFSFSFFSFFSLTICLRADSMVGTRRGSVEIRNHLDFAYKHCEWACPGSPPHFYGPRTLQRVARSCYCVISADNSQLEGRDPVPCLTPGQWAFHGAMPCPADPGSAASPLAPSGFRTTLHLGFLTGRPVWPLSAQETPHKSHTASDVMEPIRVFRSASGLPRLR